MWLFHNEVKVAEDPELSLVGRPQTTQARSQSAAFSLLFQEAQHDRFEFRAARGRTEALLLLSLSLTSEVKQRRRVGSDLRLSRPSRRVLLAWRCHSDQSLNWAIADAERFLGFYLTRSRHFGFFFIHFSYLGRWRNRFFFFIVSSRSITSLTETSDELAREGEFCRKRSPASLSPFSVFVQVSRKTPAQKDACETRCMQKKEQNKSMEETKLSKKNIVWCVFGSKTKVGVSWSCPFVVSWSGFVFAFISG